MLKPETLKAEMGRRKPQDRGQKTEAGGRRGIYQHSAAKGWFPAFGFPPVSFSQPYYSAKASE